MGGNYYDVIIFDRYFIKGSKQVYHTVLNDHERDNSDELLKSYITNAGIGWIHGILYKRHFLELNSLQFSVNTIQQEDRDFNFELFKSEPNYLYVKKAAYIYNYCMKSTINRWKKNPDGMIDAGTIRFKGNIEFINLYFLEEKARLLDSIVKKRICTIYNNAVDLYCARVMTSEFQDKLISLMQSTPLPIDCEKYILKKYNVIVKQKWIGIKIYAFIRMAYLKIRKIY